MLILRKIAIASLVLLTLPTVIAAPAQAAYPVAPDVVVFCEPTLQHAVSDVGALFHSQTGIHVRVFTSPTPLLLEQIAHHARDDVVIGAGDPNATVATKAQLIQPATLQPVGHNQLVVAAVDGSAEAARTGANPVAGALAGVAGKEPIAIVDPWAAAAAGADSKAALQFLGLWQAINNKSIGVVDTADAVFLLTRNQVPLAVVYATDVAANPGLTVAERLPAASYPAVKYWVAATARALSPNTAKFIYFLRTGDAQQRLRTDGLEISQ